MNAHTKGKHTFESPVKLRGFSGVSLETLQGGVIQIGGSTASGVLVGGAIGGPIGAAVGGVVGLAVGIEMEKKRK